MVVGLAQMVPGWKNIAAVIGVVIVKAGGMKTHQAGTHSPSICGSMASTTTLVLTATCNSPSFRPQIR